MIGIKVFAMAGVAGLLAWPGLARAEGAIAKSDNGAAGISYNQRGERAAAERAIEECRSQGNRECRVSLWACDDR